MDRHFAGMQTLPKKGDFCVHVPAVIQAALAVTKQSKALLAAVQVGQFRPNAVYGKGRHVTAWPKERPRQRHTVSVRASDVYGSRYCHVGLHHFNGDMSFRRSGDGIRTAAENVRRS